MNNGFSQLRKPPDFGADFLRKPHKICENPLKEPVFAMKKGFSQAKNGTGLSLFANLLLAGQFISATVFEVSQKKNSRLPPYIFLRKR